MKVYDCFAFFNELDLLELRLNELDNVVDHFVLVEATRTFQKKPKPLYYQDNKARFKKFGHKIIHVIVDEFPGFFYKFRVPRPWDYDNYQKDQIGQALKSCSPEDVILYSDLDEIPDPQKIIAYKNLPGIKVFRQKHFYYYLNCVEVEPSDDTLYKWWNGTVMMFYKDFNSIRKMRVQRDLHKFPDNVLIENGGWHFAYLGGVEKIIQKIESYAHIEHNTEEFKDPQRIEQIITSGKGLYGDNMVCKFVTPDESFPRYLRNNHAIFEKYIYKSDR